MNDFKLNPDDAMRQAGMTADDYLSKAYAILRENPENCSARDAIELSKVMAQDFHTSMMCLKLQEIRDSLKDVCEKLMLID